jgi:putative addiction module killer protein
VIELQAYVDRLGRNTFERWYEKLEDTSRARITVALDRLSRKISSAKSVGGGVLEQRLDFGPVYRIYFGKDGDTLIILLAGGTKKRQQFDIETAQRLWREYKQRKREP